MQRKAHYEETKKRKMNCRENSFDFNNSMCDIVIWKQQTDPHIYKNATFWLSVFWLLAVVAYVRFFYYFHFFELTAFIENFIQSASAYNIIYHLIWIKSFGWSESSRLIDEKARCRSCQSKQLTNSIWCCGGTRCPTIVIVSVFMMLHSHVNLF